MRGRRSGFCSGGTPVNPLTGRVTEKEKPIDDEVRYRGGNRKEESGCWSTRILSEKDHRVDVSLFGDLTTHPKLGKHISHTFHERINIGLDKGC